MSLAQDICFILHLLYFCTHRYGDGASRRPYVISVKAWCCVMLLEEPAHPGIELFFFFNLNAQSRGVSGCLRHEVPLKEEESARSILAFSQQPEQEARARKVRHVRANQQALLQRTTRKGESGMGREGESTLLFSAGLKGETLHLSELSPLLGLWRASC